MDGIARIVSLAAALALPLTDAAGHPFPQREPIIIITFVVILVTLVGQGLSLIPLLKWLKITDNVDQREIEDNVRIAALEAGLARLKALESTIESTIQWETIGRSQAEYRNRIDHLRHHVRGAGEPESPESVFDHFIQDEAILAERNEIMRLRAEGKIPDEVFRAVQYDLDLAAARLN